MIPRQLTLSNFLSYQTATLDFRGLHVACICGPNGAGKSSLLEAIAWSIWGQGRAATEDSIIHQGALEAQVDFTFEHQQQVYRVLRTRYRNQGGNLEFQVKTDQGFRSLTQRTMRATQQAIINVLKLDYETFVNSAYLRQGQADAFMVKRPSERKQILADLLKLCQYDALAEQAKARSRHAKVESTIFAQTLKTLETQLAQRSTVAQEAAAIAATLQVLENQQQQVQSSLDQAQQQQRQRQRQQQALTLLQQQAQHLTEQQAQLERTLTPLMQQRAELEDLLQNAATIAAGWQQLQSLQAEEEQLANQSLQVQQLQSRHQALAQQHQAAMGTLHQREQRTQAELAHLEQQLQALTPILQKQDTVAAAIERLQSAREQLRQLDARQAQVSPLLKQRQALHHQLEREQAQLATRLEMVSQSQAQLQQQQCQAPSLHQAVLTIGQTLEQLADRRRYQEQVQEKGLERRRFMDQLQAHQRACEVQLAQLSQTATLLAQPSALCPVCDRPLDSRHRETSLTHHRQEQEALQQEIWGIREQLAVSEREIQVLRQEYRDLEVELSAYDQVLEKRGKLQAQISSGQALQQQLAQLTQEQAHLERCLTEQTYGIETRHALQALDQHLAELAYDERDHALAKGRVEQLRWAEIKQAEIKQTQHKQAQLLAQQPEWEKELAAITLALHTLEHSAIAQQLRAIETQIETLGYRLDHHQQVRAALREAQPWALQHAALAVARQTHPQLQQQIAAAQNQLAALAQAHQAIAPQIAEHQAQLAEVADPAEAIARLETQLQQRQQQRESYLAQAGALQQQLTALDQLQTQFDAQQQAHHQAQRHQQVYQELATAFGRNGLQALLIENALPQLETEANQILSRLSAHQLQVQFVTQRVGRNRHKLIDTLDILIADAQGTRPYETYSGGEAFRVNFSIRIALARLLAQRAGTPLQLLIIDEGFGSQDQEGCDRLIGAINAIAPDFSCVLAVTHVPHFREAFQTRIDVVKTPDGSSLCLSA
ncbi:MAG: exonuclease subunit SbcC [Cyanobacteria bacterium]|nr:exonuclease subunit SbcC [Cyanobacteriota bacterium]